MSNRCNIVGYSDSGSKTLKCGCIDQLSYETPGFGEPGGWGSSLTKNITLCDFHTKEKEFNRLLVASKDKIFQQVYGTSKEQIMAKITELERQIKILSLQKKDMEEKLVLFKSIEK